MADRGLITVERIGSTIVSLRGHRVILDRDLAALYGVTTGALNRAVKRNIECFPGDFMFQLKRAEQTTLAQSESRLERIRFSRTIPFAFTEYGAIMAASVLNSPRAVEVSVLVVRAFVKLRELLFTHKELAKKFNELESRLANHDVAIHQLLAAIRQLMNEPPAPPKQRIGFRSAAFALRSLLHSTFDFRHSSFKPPCPPSNPSADCATIWATSARCRMS